MLAGSVLDKRSLKAMFLKLVAALSTVVGYLLVPSLDSWMIGTFACAGDVHGDDPAALGQSFAWLQMMPFVGILVSPLIGGRLAAISVRGPYAAAGVAYLLQTLVTAFRSAQYPF